VGCLLEIKRGIDMAKHQKRHKMTEVAPVTPDQLEKAYREVFEVRVERIPLDQIDLRQPKARKVVRSVTTYGAYDLPIT
jgi:hypothetical protein